MTTEEQKMSEHAVATSLLKKLDIQAELQFGKPSEEPDFLLRMGATIIGLEITEYYSSSSRKKFEEAWKDIEESLYPLNPNDEGLPSLSVAFYFKEIVVPRPKEQAQFIREVMNFLRLVSGRLSNADHYFREPDFVQDQFPLLRQYLDRMAARKIHTTPRFSWRCPDVTGGSVGMSEESLLSIVSKKDRKTKKFRDKYDELWLAIVAGEGMAISPQMGHMFPFHLPGYQQLNEFIKTTAFDKVHVFNDIWGYPLSVWSRNKGWETRIDKDGQRV